MREDISPVDKHLGISAEDIKKAGPGSYEQDSKEKQKPFTNEDAAQIYYDSAKAIDGLPASEPRYPTDEEIARSVQGEKSTAKARSQAEENLRTGNLKGPQYFEKVLPSDKMKQEESPSQAAESTPETPATNPNVKVDGALATVTWREDSFATPATDLKMGSKTKGQVVEQIFPVIVDVPTRAKGLRLTTQYSAEDLDIAGKLLPEVGKVMNQIANGGEYNLTSTRKAETAWISDMEDPQSLPKSIIAQTLKEYPIQVSGKEESGAEDRVLTPITKEFDGVQKTLVLDETVTQNGDIFTRTTHVGWRPNESDPKKGIKGTDELIREFRNAKPAFAGVKEPTWKTRGGDFAKNRDRMRQARGKSVLNPVT